MGLAIEGLTDDQIAYKMGLSPSTVNSYWVRIRGKLGHLSRSEFISVLLRQEWRCSNQVLEAQIAVLRDELASLRRNPVDRLWDWQVLDSLPEGLLVMDGDLQVRFANCALHELMGYDPGEMIGRPLEDFVYRATWMRWRRSIETYRRGPFPIDFDLRPAFFAATKGGRPLRVAVKASIASTPQETLVCCVVRSHTHESDRRRAEMMELIL